MRLLVDANLSPRIAALLGSAGFEAAHVADVGLLTAPDEAILGRPPAIAKVVTRWPVPLGKTPLADEMPKRIH